MPIGSIGVLSLKFKVLFVVFNGIIAVSLVLFFILPVLAFPKEIARELFGGFWPFPAALFLGALGMNFFFIRNFRLYRLLEKEDWRALEDYLKIRVLEKGVFNSTQVELLANTALALSDFDLLRTLETRTAQAKPALLEKHALIFGAARILNRDYAGAELFFTERAAAAEEGGLNKKKPKRSFVEEQEWLRWYRGFSLLLGYRFEKAADQFTALARFSTEPFTTALASFFMSRELQAALPARKAELIAAAEEGGGRVRKMLPNQGAWEKALAGRSEDVFVVILSKYLQETAAWLFHREEPSSVGELHAALHLPEGFEERAITGEKNA
jgi:hypothetical protein